MAQQSATSTSGKGTKDVVKTPAPGGTEPSWGLPLTSLRHEIDHLFDDFMSGWPFRSRDVGARAWDRLPAAFRSATPAADVVENGKAFVISLDLPGIEEKDIQVSVSDDVLTVRAEAGEEHKEEKENYFLSERQHGALQRAFQLPAGVDADKIDASYHEGVLRITLPKSAEAQSKERKIQVKGA